MTIGRVFPDLLTPLSSAASVEEGLAQTLRRLVELTGAAAGALVFTPPREAPIVVTAGGRRPPAELDAWLRAAVQTPAGGWRLGRGASARCCSWGARSSAAPWRPASRGSSVRHSATSGASIDARSARRC